MEQSLGARASHPEFADCGVADCPKCHFRGTWPEKIRQPIRDDRTEKAPWKPGTAK